MDLVPNIVEPYAVPDTVVTDLIRVEIIGAMVIFTLGRASECSDGSTEWIVVARNIWSLDRIASQSENFLDITKRLMAQCMTRN